MQSQPCVTYAILYFPFMQRKTILAQRTIDIWQFGTLLYCAMTSKDLFAVDHHDNLANEDDLKEIALWKETTKRQKLALVRDMEAKALLEKILNKDPDQRPQSFEEILGDDFFEVDGTKKGMKGELLGLSETIGMLRADTKEYHADLKKSIIDLKHMAEATLQQVKSSESVLRKAVFESTEIHHPTCFVILPHKLSAQGVSESTGNAEMCEHLRDIAAFGDDMGENTALGLVGALTGDPDSELQDEHEEESEDKIEDEDCSGSSLPGKRHKELTRLDKVNRNLVAVKSKTKKWFLSKIYDDDKTVYLYLVDELTGAPVLANNDTTYPIEIKSPRKALQTYMPLMSLAITAMSLVSNGAGVARMFGIPVPSLSSAVKGKMRAFAHNMSQENTAAQFDCLQKSILKVQQQEEESPQQLRDSAVRKFEGFLILNDPEENYAGLHRCLTECGAVVWTQSMKPKKSS